MCHRMCCRCIEDFSSVDFSLTFLLDPLAWMFGLRYGTVRTMLMVKFRTLEGWNCTVREPAKSATFYYVKSSKTNAVVIFIFAVGPMLILRLQ